MRWRPALLAALALAAAMEPPRTATASDEKAAPETTPVTTPLLLPPGSVVELECQTQAVLVATGAANASSGGLRLRLERTADPASDGRWMPMSESGSHAASLATMQAKTCAAGCPFNMSKDGDVQLWAPSPKGIDKLEANELLLLAIIKADKLQLKASTFRGQQIEALESGSCRRADQSDTPTAPKPDAPHGKPDEPDASLPPPAAGQDAKSR